MDELEQFVIEFEKTIPKDETYLIECFRRRLEEMKKNLIQQANDFYRGNKSRVSELLKRLAEEIILLPLEEKKQRLIKDSSYEELERVSNIIFMRAKLAYFENEVEDEEEIITKERLQELYGKTLNFNKERAKRELSEALLDLGVINGRRDITSVRLGWEIMSKKMIEKRRRKKIQEKDIEF